MDPFVIKQDDTAPLFTVRLFDGDTVVNLTGATVAFVMRALAVGHGRSDLSAVAKVDASADVADAAGGLVTYAWSAADTNMAGRFGAEIKVSREGRVTTYPSQGYISVLVVPDLR